MRILAIGDIHGCYIAFDTLLKIVDPQPQDIIVTLGDYIDRGLESKKVMERMLQLYDQGNLIPLKGNHEIMILDARRDPKQESLWRSVGGQETLFSYSGKWDTGKLTDIPDHHWDFWENKCVNYWESDDHFFVHANADPNLPLNQQPESMLFWRKFSEAKPHYSGKTMICGHTRQMSGQPLNLIDGICIDTWVYGEGWLTCLDVISGKIWQANQKGEYSTAAIDDFRPRLRQFTRLFSFL